VLQEFGFGPFCLKGYGRPVATGKLQMAPRSFSAPSVRTFAVVCPTKSSAPGMSSRGVLKISKDRNVQIHRQSDHGTV